MSALALFSVLALARACAPAVSPQTLISVVKVESGLDPLVIGVNGRPHRSLRPATLAGAIVQARTLIAGGADVDLGLTQVNVRNLNRLGLRVEDAFDPAATSPGAPGCSPKDTC